MSDFAFWLAVGLGLAALLDYKRFWFYSQFWIYPTSKRRPYTFILRDFSYNQPLLFGSIAFIAGHFLPLTYQQMVIFFSGLLAGHLWWNKDYVPNEQEQPEFNPKRRC